MWDFLWKNKEWIFSGVGVALIIFLLQLVRYTIGTSKGVSKNILSPTNSPTPQSLVRALHQVPLLQQKHIVDQYKGLPVTWEGKLWGFSKRAGDLVSVHITCGKINEVGVFFDIDPKQYPAMDTTRRGDKIRVYGKISHIAEHGVTVEPNYIEKI